MIAIATKHIPSTDTRPEGVRVSAVGIKPMFVAWQNCISGKDNHQWAAMQMAFELELAGQFFRMDNPSSKTGWLYVCVGDDIPDYAKRDGFSFRLGRAMTAAEHLRIA